MDVLSRIIEIIEPSLTAMGYSLVQVKLTDGTRRKTLTIMAERKDDVMMSFDDCTEITNTASALLDVEEPISGAYNLEVCSPGIDRPLTKSEDYTRFSGYEVKAETIIPVNGRKRFRGILKGINGDNVVIVVDGVERELSFPHIRAAKLVMNDELVAEFLKKPGVDKDFEVPEKLDKKQIKKQKTKG
ncbi:MAG: ribosome maturation factor RimP [Rickettsiales bacterium]